MKKLIWKSIFTFIKGLGLFLGSAVLLILFMVLLNETLPLYFLDETSLGTKTLVVCFLLLGSKFILAGIDKGFEIMVMPIYFIYKYKKGKQWKEAINEKNMER